MKVKKNIKERAQDHILIEELECACRVGDSPEEQAFPQVLKLTLQIASSLQKAGKADDINATVNYAKVIDQIKKRLVQKKYCLIEGVAEDVAQLVLKNFRIDGILVRLFEKNMPGLEAVGVSIWRK